MMMSKNKKQLLFNQVDSRVLKQQIQESTESRTTLSFYRYFQEEHPQELRDELFIAFEHLGILGRIYVAKEGINGQVSLATKNLEDFKTYLQAHRHFKNLRLNVAVQDDGKSFYKLILKVRDKIVADGLQDDTFDPSNMGKHLSATEFNELTTKEGTLLIDMRNHYETEVGHFKGAILPDSDTFREELPMVLDLLEGHQDKDIVMYCTGGIRCEKASAYLKHKGYANVYQLEGGIIKYAHDVNQQGLENRFIGKNFVFDERLGERISQDVIAKCHQCGNSCDDHINCANDACHLLFIQCPSCAAQYEQCCSKECQEFIKLTPQEQANYRKGKNLGRQVFKKGRVRPKLGENLIEKSLKK